MKMRFVLILALALIFASSGRDVVAQQYVSATAPRVALVIGNAKYPDAETPLREPTSDARALAEELRRDGLGFDVEAVENQTKDGMQRAFGRFYTKIKPGSVALVFFSGYAIQSARQSYLMPVDAQIWTEGDVRVYGASLEDILKEMNSRGANVKIAILDASRRNPFERRFRPVSAGLAPVNAPTGSLVMYSAAPSTVVSDSGGEHRLFVNELLKELRSPGLTGEEVFNRTRMNVSRGSQGQQVPWFSSSLISDFSFAARGKPAVALAPVETPPPAPPPPVVTPPRVDPPPVSANRPPPPKLDPVVPESRPAPPKLEPVVPPPTVESRPPAPTIESRPPAPTIESRPPAPSPPGPGRMAAADTAAIQELDKKIQSNPKDAEAYYRRGQLYAKYDDYTTASKNFDEALKINPKDHEAYNNRCWVRAMMNDLHGALSDCDEALKIRPNYVDGLDSRAFVKLKIGMPHNAIVDYDAALQIQARKVSSLYGRGIAKLRIGNTAGGNTDIAAAKAIDPGIADEFANYGIR
jgi:hypothetical protein